MLTPKHVEGDQTGTGRPVLVDQEEEHKIDFRVPGLSHAVVQEAEHLRVQGLAKRIENHLHREALHADLQQNNVYNPFSKKSKDRFLRDPVCRHDNSQSDGQNKSAKSGMNLHKKTINIISLQRKRKDTKDNGILL